MINRKIKTTIDILIPFSVIIITLILLFNFLTSKNGQVKSETYSLEKAVQNALEGSQGTYGIVIKNLKTNQTYFQNEHLSFDSGSLYKIWLMAESYEQIRSGDLKEDEILSEDVSFLNQQFDISEEEAELSDGIITLSVNDAIKQMTTFSHNYAALLLTQKVKLSSVKKFLVENNFKGSKIGINGENPSTTAYDVAQYFERLYEGQLADLDSNEKMLNFLKAQQLNNKLPKKLPSGTVIAHKTGEMDGFSHDGGIIYSPKADYIIVVMSKSDNPAGAEGRIADISEAVFHYFNR